MAETLQAGSQTPRISQLPIRTHNILWSELDQYSGEACCCRGVLFLGRHQ
jgi:hypothetical protein